MKIEFTNVGLIIIGLFLLVFFGKATLWSIPAILLLNARTIIDQIKKLKK